VQAWDFGPGHDWVHEMNQATVSAARTIAVLSPAYLRSVYGEAEWQAAFQKDPRGEHGLLVPVRIAEVDLSGLLATRVYVDLVGQDAETAKGTLLTAVQKRRAKPTREPEFPGIASNPPGQAPTFPGTAIAFWMQGSYLASSLPCRSDDYPLEGRA
jgi:hypothetical protein